MDFFLNIYRISNKYIYALRGDCINVIFIHNSLYSVQVFNRTVPPCRPFT